MTSFCGTVPYREPRNSQSQQRQPVVPASIIVTAVNNRSLFIAKSPNETFITPEAWGPFARVEAEGTT